ncbi:hypothetical protein [Erythrobacter sp. THAF29]|uniref:hypothetical protein n=1 Tax=Erythrobacter sp. THAF29 TaxID=2587851 RepID=UPI00126852F6|nr:hypothetical protein [Erythrobacter sp. THAF29]QFT77373.1 hypothetical protein FIU90_07445 [Erythrobacter sp. THAF29]
MFDEPPPAPQTLPEEQQQEVVEPHLPTEQREDGTLVIDLTPLGQPKLDCETPEPDPFNPEIVVCREIKQSPLLGEGELPEVDDFGNAIPRARVELSDNAEAEANAISQGVGGFNANGGEVRVKIDF